ncbi:DUF1737 domain-containing protein [Dyella koreensis]
MAGRTSPPPPYFTRWKNAQRVRRFRRRKRLRRAITEGAFSMPDSPPDGLPSYRLLTGKDDAAFCHRVSEALSLGYRLYGSPAATFNGEHVIVAQALLWPEED